MALPDEQAVDAVMMALEKYGYGITTPEAPPNFAQIRLAIANALWGRS